MSEPFVPAGAPDRDFDVTYAAVGKALSAWERLEIHLSHLYAVFVGKPWRREALLDFGQGDEGRIFTTRMAALSAAAERYFARRCDQASEGAFNAIVA